MIRHPKFGIGPMIDVMNSWMAEWAGKENFRLLRYEDWRVDPEKAFREMLLFLGFHGIDESILARSVEFASFDNMKAMETTGQLDTGILSPGDPGDPESFKVRRGLVGGYREYLSSEDVHYLDQAVSLLDKRYGYR